MAGDRLVFENEVSTSTICICFFKFFFCLYRFPIAPILYLHQVQVNLELQTFSYIKSYYLSPLKINIFFQKKKKSEAGASNGGRLRQRAAAGHRGGVELRAERRAARADGAVGARRAGQGQGRDGGGRRRRWWWWWWAGGDPDGTRRPVGVPVLPDDGGRRGRRGGGAPVRGAQLLLLLRRPRACTEVRKSPSITLSASSVSFHNKLKWVIREYSLLP